MDPSQLFKKLNFFAEPEFQKELLENGKLMTLNKGDVIVKDGQYVRFLPIVINGSIRVYQQKEDREILLYYVRAEETCTMSLAAAYFNNKSTSHGVAVEPTELFIFPSNLIIPVISDNTMDRRRGAGINRSMTRPRIRGYIIIVCIF